MKAERKWIMALLQRVIVNAAVGGFAFASTGVACGLAAGAFTGFLWLGFDGAYIGVFLGGAVGVFSGLAGALIYAVAATRAKPGPPLDPYTNLRKRVSSGQALGTLGACSSFVVFEIASAQVRAIPFADVVSNDSFVFMFVAPAFMILSAIAAAILGRAHATATRTAD